MVSRWNSMDFQWVDYVSEDAKRIDSWLDDTAKAMTGIDQGWEDYWQAVLADSVNFPGCVDFCKMIYLDHSPVAVVAYGCYQGDATISEIVVAPDCRGKGLGTRIIKALITNPELLIGRPVKQFDAVIFPENLPSRRAFQKAGFAACSGHANGDAGRYFYIGRLSRSVEQWLHLHT